MNIKNKTVLITGGAVRIGKFITLEMVRLGANVYCHYNNSSAQAQALSGEVKKLEGSLKIFQADFSQTEKAIAAFSELINSIEQVDVLINNAAIFFKTPLEDVKESDWDRLFSINLKTPFFISQKIGLKMKDQGYGKIINIGDASGITPWPGYLPYSLTKSGVIAMTKGLAKALAPEVLVNCINPGPVLIPDYYDESEMQKIINKTLVKKTGSPEDIIETIKYLIEGSDYLTGSIINVDGGRHLN